MSDIEIRESEELVLPTGELIDLADVPRCASALRELRDLEQRIKEVKGVLTDALVVESQRLGSKTIPLPDGHKAIVTGGERVLWDVSALEHGLRKAGMDEDSISEIIRQEVTYSVVAGRAKRAAGANEKYAKVIESCKTIIDERPSIAIRKG